MEFTNIIKIINDNSEERITGTIIKISDEGILAEFLDDNLMLNTKVFLILSHMTMGEMLYEAEVYDLHRGRILFKNLKFMNNIQRRIETRATYEVPLEVRKVFCDQKEINLNKKVALKTIDLSANGIQLSCDLDFPANITFPLSLPIENEMIDCHAVIKRKIVKDDYFHYGCMLIISEALRNKIRRFVFKIQLEERKKQKEKSKYNEQIKEKTAR